MNFNTFYVFVVCFLFAFGMLQAKIVCPKDQPDDSLVVQFPSPTNCSEFYKCDRGVAFVIPCPRGLEYNAALEVRRERI